MSVVPSKTVGNLTIYDNGYNGLSWERCYRDEFGKPHKEYEGISAADMLEYLYEENLPNNFREVFTTEEQDLFIKEYYRIMSRLRA